MANKITQLVNESGDNLYPLAGGMAADSINTQMLQDASVTSDKIDWTTIHPTVVEAGRVSLPSIQSGNTAFVTVNFSTTQQDNNYVILTSLDTDVGSGQPGIEYFTGLTWITRLKTTSSFQVLVANGQSGATGDGIKMAWAIMRI